MADTKIEWCDKTWNLVVGCTKCSSGCLNCYAERMANRQKYMCLANNNNPQYLGKTDDNGKWTGEVECCDWKLEEPLHWRKPCRIFVCSMSDLFHEKVPFEFICQIFETIQNAGQHTYLILTKRVKEMKKFFQECEDWDASEWPNVHLGVSISNQAEADEKIPILLEIPAAVRWLSIEPLLGPIDFVNGIKEPDGSDWWNGFLMDTNEGIASHLHWVVVGGESGPGARPMHPDWVRNIREQCIAANVPFYFKQWGKWIDHSLTEIRPTKKNAKIVFPDGSTWPWSILSGRKYDIAAKSGGRTVIKVGKKKAGRMLDGKEWVQLPERK